MHTVDDLLHLMARLREPGSGCPWDLAQSYKSIAPSTLEEAYEVVDAIERNDPAHLKEELGDLLFQVIFYSQLGKEDGHFDFSGIVSELVAKLIRRHPHVFPEGTLESRVDDQQSLSDDVKQRWETIKQEERASKGAVGVLADVPLNLPSLTRATKLQKRAAGVGFDWDDIQGPIAKVREELAEVEEALEQDDRDAVIEEVGDLLFAVVNISRYLKIDAESALRAANRKFEKRFHYMEENSPAPVTETDMATLNRLWDAAKTKA